MSFVLGVLTILLIFSCSGGGGGGSGNGGGGDPGDRETLFQEEAIQRVLDIVMVECQTIDCPAADFEQERNSSRPGVMRQVCFYECVEVELPGEVRHYIVDLIWERLTDGCYVRDDHTVQLVGARVTKCVPNF